MRGNGVTLHLMFLLLCATCGSVNIRDNRDLDYEYCLFKTQELNKTQAETLFVREGGSWDFWEGPRKGAAALIFSAASEASSMKNALQEMGIQFSKKSFTFSRVYPDDYKINRNMSFTRFLRLEQIYKYLDDLRENFPDIVTVLNIGSSVMNEDLKVIRISKGQEGDKHTSIFIDAGIHGRDWIAPPVALYTIFQLVENYSVNKELLDGMDWYILPVFNPDGYVYTFNADRFWRKTWSFNGDSDCFGVDIDRNFEFHWGEAGVSDDPCSPVFGGHEAFSDIEARAFVNFVKDLGSELKLYLSLRSYGPSLIFPWDFTTDALEDADELREVAESAAAALEVVRGTKYMVGSASNVDRISSGTITDWMKGVMGVKYVYTMNLPPGGTGFDPSPDEILPVVEETFQAIKALANEASRIDN